MKLKLTMLALSMSLSVFTVSAQTLDLGPDKSGYRRFLLYPHLERGFAAMARGNRGVALAEFEQARALAPDNPVVAIHLSEAYLRFGEPARAEALLREQLMRNADNERLIKALTDLRGKNSRAAQLSAAGLSLAAPSSVPAATGQSQPDSVVTQPLLSGMKVLVDTSRPGPAAPAMQADVTGSAGLRRADPANAVGDSAYAFADAAYKASASGDHAAAARAARQAVRLAPDNRAYYWLLVYELSEIGQLEEADAVAMRAPPAAAGVDDELAARQKVIRQNIALKKVEQTNKVAAAAQAEGASEAARNNIQPASDPAYPFADAAYKAFEARNYELAASKAREAVALSTGNLQYRTLLVNSLIAGSRLEQADQELSNFISGSPASGELLALRSTVRMKMGQQTLAGADAEAALRSGELSVASEIGMLLQLGRKMQARERFAAAQRDGGFRGQSDVDIAYLALQVSDDPAALAAFNQASSSKTLPSTALQDSAYVAARLGRNEEAVNYFKQAIDASDAGQLPLTPQQQFEASRSIADRTRKGGVYGSLSYRGIPPSGLSLQPGVSNDSLQTGLEAYWRPFGYGDGRLVELYGGLAGTLYSKAGLTTGAPSVEGALGARVKPLADTNLILALERRQAIGSQTRNDWLARVGYSWSQGLDLRVDAPDWWSAQVYAEAGRRIKSKQTYGAFETQAGRSFRLDQIHPKLVIFPHVVLGADHNTGYEKGKENAVGAGVGTGLRYWFNGDKYSAPRSYWDASLQYRGRISGDDRAKGVFLRFTLFY